MAAVVIAIALVCAGCSGRGASSTSTTTTIVNKTVSPVPGFDGTTIRVGVLTPLSGPVAAPIGAPLAAGGDVYWKRVNAGGGIAGKYKVEVVSEDNAYDPAQTMQKYTKIKDQVVMFSQIFGTRPTHAVLSALKADKLSASPASLDSAWVREPNLLPVGSTYQLQFINAAIYLVDELGFRGKPICIIAEDGAFGDAGIAGLTFAGKQLNFQPAVTARFKSTDQEITAAVTQLKNGNCSAAFVTTTPTQTGKIIAASAQLGFTPQWVGQSPTWANMLASSQVAPIFEKSFLLSGDGAQWGDPTVPGMRQMLDDIQKYKPDQQPDGYFAFGYVQALAVDAVLEQAVKNGDLSRAGVLNAIEQAKPDYKGLYGAYKYGKAAQREPSRTTSIFKIDKTVPGNLKKVKDMKSQAALAFTFD